jgi:hypothetical protein
MNMISKLVVGIYFVFIYGASARGGRVDPLVMEIAEADAHVARDVIGNRDRQAHAEDPMRERQRVEVAIAQEECARDGSPY